MEENIKQFIMELKNIIRDRGRTNMIDKSEIDMLFVKHNINVKELENE